jgi:hypothetical protein
VTFVAVVREMELPLPMIPRKGHLTHLEGGMQRVLMSFRGDAKASNPESRDPE